MTGGDLMAMMSAEEIACVQSIVGGTSGGESVPPMQETPIFMLPDSIYGDCFSLELHIMLGIAALSAEIGPLSAEERSLPHGNILGVRRHASRRERPGCRACIRIQLPGVPDRRAGNRLLRLARRRRVPAGPLAIGVPDLPGECRGPGCAADKPGRAIRGRCLAGDAADVPGAVHRLGGLWRRSRSIDGRRPSERWWG